MIDFPPDWQDFMDDPILAPKDAAQYIGRSTRVLRRCPIERSPMPGRGAKPEWGYRRSALNRYLRRLAEAAGSTQISGV